MGADTKIEWADHTFNPWVGCAKIGPGCDHCYAETWARRTGHPELWDGKRRRTKTWGNPLKWNRDAKAKGVRYRVFCASLADVFDNAVPGWWREGLWDVIRATSHLDWIIVTKRIGNAAAMLPPDWGNGWPHVWLLATICNQAEADRDVPKLLATPAAARGISYEPALGPIDLSRMGLWLCQHWKSKDSLPRAPWCPDDPSKWWWERQALRGPGQVMLDWIICGGESGPQARPMHSDWARSVRDQCQAAGVAFFFKQWGAYRPAGPMEAGKYGVFPNGDVYRAGQIMNPDGAEGRTIAACHVDEEWERLVRAGKKAYGRRLDGRTWDEYPKGAAHG